MVGSQGDGGRQQDPNCSSTAGLEALDGWHQAVFETKVSWVRPDETFLLDRARAALAAEPDGPAVPESREPASVVGEPSDEELLELAAAEMNNAPNWEEPEYSYEAGNPFPYEAPGVAWLNFARAVLARYGHQPAPPAAGEVAELVAWLRMQGEAQKPGPNSLLSDQTKKERHAIGVKLTRAADLLERHPAPVPAGMIPVEYWDIDSGARIVTEPSEEGPGGCWVVLNSRHVNPFTEFPTAKAAWDALQQAHALPLPQGEV